MASHRSLMDLQVCSFLNALIFYSQVGIDYDDFYLLASESLRYA